MKKQICVLLAIIMVFSLMTGMLETSALAAEEPANIQDTYEIDGATYFNVGSNNFAVEKTKFYRDLLGTRSSLIAQEGYFNDDWSNGDYGWVNFDLCEADLWLQLGAMIPTDLKPDTLSAKDIEMLFKAAVTGSDSYEYSSGAAYTAARHDLVGKTSMKEAEDWVFQQAFGGSKSFGIFKNDTAEQPVLVTAVSNKLNLGNDCKAIAVYFTNFRVFAIMPADEGANYVTELVKDSVNSQSTTASTVKNLTASTVTGSQTVSNSTTASVSSSVSGSESYSFTEGVKVGAEFAFTKVFKMSGELSFSASQAFSTGWGTGESVSDTRSASYSVSVPLSPYTQVMMTQTDSTSVYLTSYNCPIAIKYDVKIVMYKASNDGIGDGVMHIDYTYPAVDRDAIYTFADPVGGARADLDNRINRCTEWGDMDADCIRWRLLQENSLNQYSMHDAAGALEKARTHIPMAPTGASYLQTLNVVASEISGLMPTHPLYRVKIAEPGVGVHSNEVSYQLFDYFTANMEVGDFSYTNYMSIVGFNKFDVPFYGFSKDNGYWVVTDMQGNPLSDDESPVRLEKDPVSTNWRYTAIRPGSCFLVYRIDEDAYFIADKPDQPIKNSDLVKTAALEVIVTEKDPTDTIVISGSYQGHPDLDPASLEGDDKLTVAVYDETGKEIEKPYSWEAKELRGITVTADGQVSFTKEGTYHVRAVNGKLRSDWYTITAAHTPANVVQENAVAPTCTEPGCCDLVTCCEICGAELSREHIEEAALDHDWDAGNVTQEPTASEDGVMTYTCTRCSETRTETIPKLTPTPTITVQPASKEAYAGTSVDFSVEAENADSYRWQYQSPGTDIWCDSDMIGAQTDRIVVNATDAHNGQRYRCVVSNAYGSTVSEPAVLTVLSVPVIRTDPNSVTTTAGNTIKFTVSATGTDLRYQWQYKSPGGSRWNNSGMTGAQTATVSVPATAARNGQQYRCVVTNDLGSATSGEAMLTVLSKPAIKAQPESVRADCGDMAKFTVAATGSNLTYQWQYQKAGSSTWYNSTLAGNKTATLTVEATEARNGMQFRCVVKNNIGTATSNAATLTVVQTAPVITTQPQNTTVTVGELGRFRVVATGGGLSYQWQYKSPGSSTWKNSTLSGAKTNAISIRGSAALDGQQYRCIVTNALGEVTSDVVTLSVPSAPVITTQPADKTAAAGSSVKFKVKATGSDLTYQWQYQKAGSSTWYNSTLTGNKTATLTVSATAVRNGMQFRCVIKNDLGTVTSNAAKLTVN